MAQRTAIEAVRIGTGAVSCFILRDDRVADFHLTIEIADAGSDNWHYVSNDGTMIQSNMCILRENAAAFTAAQSLVPGNCGVDKRCFTALELKPSPLVS